MDIHDYVELIALAFWVISVVSVGILSHVHFKNKRLERLRIVTSNLMKSYINMYDQENLSDEKKINRVGNAGDQHHWFIGTKPVNDWCTQIARIDLTKQNVQSPHTTNLDFPRLAHLNRIGNQPYDGSLMYRVEAAVSPDYQKLLIMTVDKNYTAHFTFYDLPTINQALDSVEANSPQKRYVSMENQPLTGDSNFQSFSVDNFYNPDDVAGKDNYGSTNEITNSIQGVDIDNSGNIYISCQPSPTKINKKYVGHHKQIIKIPYYAHDDLSSWISVNLSQYAKENSNTFDLPKFHSEVESIQIISENYGYLTISYHRDSDGLTTLSRIFKISW